MTLADRLNKIIEEQNISKQDFAARVGISRNYLYILTGNSGKNKNISRALAKLISVEFGYDEDWIINGEK